MVILRTIAILRTDVTLKLTAWTMQGSFSAAVWRENFHFLS